MLAIRKGGHRDLERYYGLIEVDFDSEELLGKLNIHMAMTKGELEFLIFYEDQRQLDLGYALVLHKGLYGYVLLKHFGVFPWNREHGLGVEFMRLLNKRYADKQGILAEITEFEDSDPDHQRKLIKFFARFGYVELNVNETHRRHQGPSDGQAHPRQRRD